MAKDLDNVWKRAIVVDLLLEENQCAIRYESGNKQLTVIDMKNVLPLSQQQGGNELTMEFGLHLLYIWN